MTGSRLLRRMAGRDIHESHRVSTPLELLFDLTFVVAIADGALLQVDREYRKERRVR